MIASGRLPRRAFSTSSFISIVQLAPSFFMVMVTGVEVEAVFSVIQEMRISFARVFCNLGLVIAHHGPAIAAGKFQLNNGAHTVSGNFFRQNGIIQIGEKLCSESTGDGAAIFGVSGENTVQIQITAELFGVKFF